MHRTSQVSTGILFAASVSLVTLFSGSASAHHHHHTPEPDASLSTVALFDAGAMETPESIAIDDDDNKFVSLALTGEIRKISHKGVASTYATLPLGAAPLTICGSFFAGLTGITLDHQGNLYANLASCDSDSRGVWKIPRYGQPERIAALPMESLPNGIVHHKHHLFVSDSTLGVIWRVSDDGGTPEVWASGEELAQEETPAGLPGPNGLKFFDDEMYVSNPSQATIVAIRVKYDGSAGKTRIHADGLFCDDFVIDKHGYLYCGTDPFNTLMRVAPNGSSEVLLTADDGLDGPTAIAFGDHGDRQDLFITNAAYPFFPQSDPRPSLMQLSFDNDGGCH